MCIRDRYQRRVRGKHDANMCSLFATVLCCALHAEADLVDSSLSSQTPPTQQSPKKRQPKDTLEPADLSRHCVARMKERGISKEEVRACVLKGAVLPGGRDRCIKLSPCNVTVVIDTSHNRVVTTYRTDDAADAA
eukprot:TRINITY_DN12694_c0_g1_i1.p1 TRINITY_DN12694_c0_g1~~TRINITY_DN12694_c0_g1_i1.p1  ORF type:complete len:135 (-),score=22.07 TRINITY_DN12694_c0_g1_i1:162-566(-)